MKIDCSKCCMCQTCTSVCPAMAISMKDGKMEIDTSKCMSCGTCASVCPMQAITH